jgi:hypothetical protein
VYVSIVAPNRRMSDRVPEAEKRERVASGIRASRAEVQSENSELEWKNGNGA